MKKIILLITMYCASYYSFGQCNPASNGLYEYYVNLKYNNVPINFNKTDFINFINDPSRSTQLTALSNAINTVKRTLDEPLSPLLARSISVFSTNANLDTLLQPFSSKFYFFEKKCNPFLIQQTNDYAPTPDAGNLLTLIKTDKAWDITKGSSQIKIGITDTYIDTAHEDLTANIDSVLYNGASHFHGVGVAGCAAAVTNNGKGIASSSYNSKIVFSSNWGNLNEVQKVAKIKDVRVINMSWGHCVPSITEQDYYQQLLDSFDVVLVAGAGNIPSHCGSQIAPMYPAAYPSVICVTSVGHYNDRGIIDPTYGKIYWKDCHEQIIGDTTSTHHHYPEVDICAPGYSVYTTQPGNTYSPAWGTSFASPIVAAVCALVASANPCLRATEIKDIVLNTADPTMLTYPENAKYAGGLGKGRVDAYEAVKRAILVGTNFQQNTTYTSTQTISAQTDVKAGYNVTATAPYGNVIINTGANITYEAPHAIILSNNFIVKNGATFKAKTITSPCY